ncbi:calcium-binding protein [Kumtagia ephedrae]|uniref:calcium-binding protein n=1 Tax=Kumtagia ephedrae TaxID=2116701 RepID=UPI000EAA6D7D|nr:calcium-binding protein [Mesorhizobium ephedrae]
MTTVTITVDDPGGVDTNSIFASTAPYSVEQARSENAGTTGRFYFERYVDGVVDYTKRLLFIATGNGIEPTGEEDLRGNVSAVNCYLADETGASKQWAHVTFALDGLWTQRGGVTLESFAMLTPDTLMGRVMQGSSASLVLIGNVGNDTLRGSFLDDRLQGGKGADRLIGGEGTDIADYSTSDLGVTVNLATGAASGGHAAGDRFSSIENVAGSAFADTLTGDDNANFFDGGAGLDVIDGGGGDDFIFGRDGGGTLRGGAGNDRIDGGVDADTIHGGSGNDELRVGGGSNYGYGEDGNDILLGDAGIDRLYGGAGSDRLNGVSGNDILDGGSGADTMSGGDGATQYFVDNAADVVDDFVQGDNDTLFASTSYVLKAGSAIEVMRTTSTVSTAALNLTGNAFAQSITGNAGANVLHDGGVGGADRLSGLAGNDSYIVYNAGAVIVEAASHGTADRVSAGVDYRLGTGVHVEVMATTSSGSKAGVDLTGNEFAQSITGNAGANRLEGKGGNDTLRGLGGADTFVFATALGSGNVDTIADFKAVDDRFLLSDAIFTALAPGVLSAAAFRANTTGLAQDSSDRIIYETDTGELYYDANGSAAGGGVLFARLTPGLSLTNADFAVA